LIVVFTADSKPVVTDAALVLSAIDIDNQITSMASGWSLLVQEQDQQRAHTQLQLYWQENQPSKITPVEATIVDSGWPGVIGYLCLIWFIPAAQAFTTLDLLALGRLDAGLVTTGEWWRVVTALTLHGDIAHIIANSLFGAVFGLFVGRYLGSGFGWMLVLICGALANLANAFVQADSFRAIGASTATFAALGIVPAFGWRRGFFRGKGFKRGFAPIFAAIALLVFTGFGGENVDVLGHVFGFSAGIVMGLVVANTNFDNMSKADHQRAGVFAIGVVLSAWLFAL